MTTVQRLDVDPFDPRRAAARPKLDLVESEAETAPVRPLRIVHLVTRSHRRGAEVVAMELADELDEFGHHNELLSLGKAFDGSVDPKLTPLVDTKRIGVGAMLVGGWRLRRRLSKDPADVVVAHGGWAAQVAAFGLRSRHGHRVWQRILGFPIERWGRFKRRYWSIVASRFDAAIAISEQLEDEMTTLEFQREVWRIPNARNPTRFEAGDREVAAKQLRHELSLEESAVVVGFVGHLVPQKQPQLAIEALASIHDRGRDVHLVIAGDGPMRRSLERLVETLGLTSSVSFLGHRDDVESIYKGVDVVLITSAHEGVPGVAIEAQMAGCPLVTFAVGAVTDVIEQDVTGIVVELDAVDAMADAAVALLDDETRRETMSVAGRSRTAEHSTKKTAAMYAKRLQTLVGEPADEQS